MVVFEAVRAEWLAKGLDAVLPNGIYWGDPPQGTPVPYCEFSVMAVTDDFYSNNSVYRGYPVQFKVHDLDQDKAGRLVDLVSNAMEDCVMALPLGEGSVYDVSRSSVAYTRTDETTWAAAVAVTPRRCAPRTRGRH